QERLSRLELETLESVRTPAGKRRRDGQRQNSQVVDDRHVLAVEPLDGEPLRERELAPPVDLHRPGDAGLHRKALAMLRLVLLHQLELLGSWAHQAHLT